MICNRRGGGGVLPRRRQPQKHRLPPLTSNMLEISCLLSNTLRVARAETQDRTGMEQVQPVFKLTNLIGQFDWSRHVSVFRRAVFSLFAFRRCDRTGTVASRSYICCCDWSEIFDWWIFFSRGGDSFTSKLKLFSDLRHKCSNPTRPAANVF